MCKLTYKGLWANSSGDVGDHERGARHRQLGRQGDVPVASGGLFDLVADHLAGAAHDEGEVAHDLQAPAALREHIVADDIAFRRRVTDVVGSTHGLT